jgi:YegS/Rv2252/BmrU family lipid kinase
MQIDKSEILFIINPASGQRNPEKIIAKIKNDCPGIRYIVTRNKEELDSVFTLNPEEFKVFVAVGGDGTANEIARYLQNNKEKILAIYPNGSGNGFANELGFVKNFSSLLDDILRGETIDIDVLDVNGHPCINMMGLGFDSFVAHSFQQSSRGLKNYILSTLKSVFWFKPFEATITTASGNELNGKFIMVSVANTRQYGNHAIASPTSLPNDGVFETILVRPFPVYLFPVFVWKMFTAKLKDSKYIRYIRETKAAIIVSDYQKYHIDGEPFLGSGKMSVSICKNSLRVIRTKNNPIPQAGSEGKG